MTETTRFTTDAEVHYLYTGDNSPVDDGTNANEITHVTVDASVKVISDEAFQKWHALQVVSLPEGLEKIDALAFHECESLEQINIPVSLKEIGKGAFSICKRLSIQLVLPEGLQLIGPFAFEGCTSLTSIVIPSTVHTISYEAFTRCTSLVNIEIKEGVKKVGGRAFQECTSLQTVSLPSTITTINGHAFSGCSIRQLRLPAGIQDIQQKVLSGCNHIFSIELPETLDAVKAFQFCDEKHLRNIATPPNCKLDPLSGYIPSIEAQVIISRPRDFAGGTMDTLKSRFDGLPIHQICYYQSYHSVEVTAEDIKKVMNSRWPVRSKLNPTGGQKDCLGMTPLHILACSQVHHLKLYQMLNFYYPSNLILEDVWGDVPLLYALWGNAPTEVVELLVNGQKEYFPNHAMDTKRIVTTLCMGNAPLQNIKFAIDTLQEHFPSPNNESICEKVLTDLSPDEMNDMRAPIFEFLLRYGISDRLDALSNAAKWRRDIEDMLSAFVGPTYRKIFSTQVYSKLALYEELNEASILLELVLWKAKINRGSGTRKECRVTCGAAIVIPKVVSYLGGNLAALGPTLMVSSGHLTFSVYGRPHLGR